MHENMNYYTKHERVTLRSGDTYVCSVKFQRESMNSLAFGSADYDEHYSDVRYPAEAVRELTSHSRTVRCVKFLSANALVSACVDSTIKLWDLDCMPLERTFKGKYVLLFVDDSFRYAQANAEVSAFLDRTPSAAGYQPTLATDLRGMRERITTIRRGSITS